jgi:hypothetical protein
MANNTLPKPALDYQRDEHRIHLIVYHLIWIPKRRKPVLTGPIATDCRKLIEQKCSEKEWSVLELAIQPDHIHLFVRVADRLGGGCGEGVQRSDGVRVAKEIPCDFEETPLPVDTLVFCQHGGQRIGGCD